MFPWSCIQFQWYSLNILVELPMPHIFLLYMGFCKFWFIRIAWIWRNLVICLKFLTICPKGLAGWFLINCTLLLKNSSKQLEHILFNGQVISTNWSLKANYHYSEIFWQKDIGICLVGDEAMLMSCVGSQYMKFHLIPNKWVTKQT